MNLLVLYLLLVKAALTSFSGLGSLPIVRNDFVVQRNVMTDRQLNTAVAAGRTGPGPYGLYLVCVGYLAGGIPGAIAGLLAIITPSFLAIPLVRWIGKRAESPRVRGGIQGLLLAAAGLLVAAAMPLTRDAILRDAATGNPLITGVAGLILIASFFALTFTRINSAALMACAATVGLATLLLR